MKKHCHLMVILMLMANCRETEKENNYMPYLKDNIAKEKVEYNYERKIYDIAVNTNDCLRKHYLDDINVYPVTFYNYGYPDYYSEKYEYRWVLENIPYALEVIYISKINNTNSTNNPFYDSSDITKCNIDVLKDRCFTLKYYADKEKNNLPLIITYHKGLQYHIKIENVDKMEGNNYNKLIVTSITCIDESIDKSN